MNNKICQRAFCEIEIHIDGNVTTCCPDYFKERYYIGNIFEVSSFDEIWYSEKAKKLRRNLLKNNYELCNTNVCNPKEDDNTIEYSETPPYPKLVRFTYDTQCNVRCIFCRDKQHTLQNSTMAKYDELIESIFIPVLKNAQIMSITSSGEITASHHSKKLLKKAAETYPDLKFELLTNGLLFNENFIKSMGLENRIQRVVLSMHSIKKSTYEKIVRGSNFETVLENLKEIFKMKKEGKINEICLIFVVFLLNYKEIPKFIEYALANEADPIIWEYRNRNSTDMDKQYKKYAIWESTHPKYNDFVKIINEIKNKYGNNCRMPEFFKELKPNPFTKSIINQFNSLFY